MPRQEPWDSKETTKAVAATWQQSPWWRSAIAGDSAIPGECVLRQETVHLRSRTIGRATADTLRVR